MELPHVSVVIPTRDRMDTLPTTVSSVLGQVGVEVDLVVVDDGSSDGTLDYLDRLGDRRVRVIEHPPPHGVAHARNAGLAEVRAPLVAFVDSDDVWAPDKLSVQVEALRAASGARWSCVGALHVDGRLRPIACHRPPPSGDLVSALLGANVVPGGGSGTLLETTLLRALGGFDQNVAMVEDWDVWLRVALEAPVVSVDRPLVAYRVWTGSVSADSRRSERAHAAMSAKWDGFRAERHVQPDRAQLLMTWAEYDLRNGHRFRAAGRHLELVRCRRDWRGLATLAACVAAPGPLARRHQRADLAQVPGNWLAEAGPWLARWREWEAAGTHRSAHDTRRAS